MKYCLGYVTCSGLKEARKLANGLLEKKWIGCANLLPGMESIYFWKGKVNTGKEVVLIIKTTSSFQRKVTKWLEENHSYDIPCVLWLSIEKGNAKYLKWLISNLT